MKKSITIILMLLSVLSFAQTERQHSEINFTESHVNSLKFVVDSIKELNDINWVDIKEIFKENNPNDNMSLEFVVKTKEIKSIEMHNFSFKVKGKSKNIDNLIKQSKKGINVLKKMKFKL